MSGSDANTGKPLAGRDHVRQSVRDILTTPIGTRVLNRTYGSRLFELVDAPMNESTKIDIYAATAEALGLWEPRIVVDAVAIQAAEPGRIVLDLTGRYVQGGPLSLDGIVIQ